jgi:hypothetical protein
VTRVWSLAGVLIVRFEVLTGDTMNIPLMGCDALPVGRWELAQ